MINRNREIPLLEFRRHFQKKTLCLRVSVFSLIFISSTLLSFAQNDWVKQYNPVWETPSKNALASMPCGGGDIGLNVWVEDGDVMVYMAQSGTFDENNAMPKLGRLRIILSPNPFTDKGFKQELQIANGSISIKGNLNDSPTELKIRVDVFKPLIHIDIKGKNALTAQVNYETWRFADHHPKKKENNGNSYKWAAPDTLKTYADSVRYDNNGILFYHQNRQQSIFDVTVAQQGLESVKSQLHNPLDKLIFGGYLLADNFAPCGLTDGKYADTPYRSYGLKNVKPSKTHHVTVVLHHGKYDDVASWQTQTTQLAHQSTKSTAADYINISQWWQNFWERSFIVIDPDRKLADSTPWQIGRNYQLFRHMLGCNAIGDYPTKFNGGLFTVDPAFTDSSFHFTPDFRNWGGGTFTAQNQRLVYWPMLKSGDAALMKPQFDFYLRLLKNAELRSQFYWNHNGACFTEQIENFGLPNPSEYGWKRPIDFDKGMEYNAWLEYQWDTVLEFCQMILESRSYAGNDISQYLPLIESCLTFFDEHYQQLASQRGRKALDANGQLVLYPGSACETYKMAYNANSTISALQTVTETLLALPDEVLSADKKVHWLAFRKRIPPLSLRTVDGKTILAPAKLWERVNNTETPQLYPVFPWGIYGLGKDGLDTAINTYKYDTDALKFRSHVGWKQDNIWAARLGLIDDAKSLTLKKLADSGRRYPAFWGPGYDWVPDHNWGGSGMIGLQEMLLQTVDNDIWLFPAWPVDWDVHFKLHAPNQTTVEASLKNGKVEFVKVWPESRAKDVKIKLR
jgi:hypothetical protein